MKTLKHTGTVT
jgi:hypothetical protein